jgi:hypothetical protein
VSDPTRQFKRVCQVILGKAGQGLEVNRTTFDPSGFRVQFEIAKVNGRSPNTAMIKIYNLSQDNEGKIRGEFDDVLVTAGYDGTAVLVFRGNIRHADAYGEPPNRILQIDAADGDHDFRKATVNFSLASGTTTNHAIDHVVAQLSNTTKGTVRVKDQTRSRGRVFCGMARDVLDDIAAENDAHWSIQDGALQIIPVDETLPTEAIVISAETGMISAPVRDDKGIKVKCLLNPRVKVGGKIWLNNNNFKESVRQARATLPGAKTPKKHKAEGKLARTDPDGVYKVYRVDHKGDTRGDEWYSEIMCVALESSIPASRGAA